MPGTAVALRTSRRTKQSVILYSILALYLLGRIIEVLPFSTPSTPIVALEILSALAFALVHGFRVYGVRGICVFTAMCLVIGNVIENVGVLTGIPFGHYVFLDLMGPKILYVPVLLGLAYIGMAYVSWMVAQCILMKRSAESARWQRTLAVPILAAVVMTAWDFAQDPVWSTLLHAWVWFDGGPWFGVPLSNYVGWFLTVFSIYLAFAMYLRFESVPAGSRRREAWLAVILYALCAVGNVAQLLRPQRAEVIADATGKLWRTAAILHASAEVSICVMGLFVALAAHRLQNFRTGDTEGPSVKPA